MELIEALSSFKSLIENSILEGGEKAKQAMIRSSKPIQNIHEAVKTQLIKEAKIESERIYPTIKNTKPELTLSGFFKKKAQDICITPKELRKQKEILQLGFLCGESDQYGIDFTEKTISINVRSQISSLAKNFDTLYERTIFEAYNLHMRCPKMCLGEVYMIAVPEYDSDFIKNNQINAKHSPKAIEKYIKSFEAINNRKDYTKEEYKYERVCLLIVNFDHEEPIFYETDKALKDAKLLPEDSTVSIESLNWENFTTDLLNVYAQRFKG